MRLHQFSDRSLNFIASMVAGREVRVFRADRLTEPLIVALEGDSVGLRWDAHLYDLFLGASLVRHRADGRQLCELDNRIPDDVVKQWEREDNRWLREKFPRILELPGHHHPERCVKPPVVVWQDVPLKKLDWDKAGFRHVGMDTLPGLSFENISDDFPGLLRAIRIGRQPLQHFPGFSLPIATIPLSVTTSQAYPAELEKLETSLNRYRHLEDEFLECYVKSSEGVLDTSPSPTRFLTGTRLDHTRLADAIVARTQCRPARIFRKKDSRQNHPFFQAEEHLAIHAVDLNFGLGEGTLTSPRWSGQQVAFLSRVMEKLGVGFGLIGFADRVVDAGQPVYLHCPISLKDVSNPHFDGGFHSRVAHLCFGNALKNIPGEPATYHPLQLKTIGELFRKENEAAPHAFHCLIWAASEGMPRSMGQFHTSEYWYSTANMLDDQFRSWQREFPRARWNHDFLFLPRELKRSARKGGILAGAKGW